jgi:hypothetical protein
VNDNLLSGIVESAMSVPRIVPSRIFVEVTEPAESFALSTALDASIAVVTPPVAIEIDPVVVIGLALNVKPLVPVTAPGAPALMLVTVPLPPVKSDEGSH